VPLKHGPVSANLEAEKKINLKIVLNLQTSRQLKQIIPNKASLVFQ